MLLSQLLDRALRNHASEIAVEHGEERMTYADVDADTRRRVALLRQVDADAGPVALVGEHSLTSLLWALAIMRSGHTYVPISGALPLPRVAESVRHANASVVVHCETPFTDGARIDADDVAQAVGNTRHAFDYGGSAVLVRDTSRDEADVSAAYCIFTSGSTGQSKLVNVSHDGILNLCQEQSRVFGVRQGTRVLQFAALSFDASVAEVLSTLWGGGCLVLPTAVARSWAAAVSACLKSAPVDVATFPPSVYMALDEAARNGVGTVVFAGEALPENVYRVAAERRRVFNAYGPSEATVCVSMTELEEYSHSVGRPLEGFSVAVRDLDSDAVADTGRGELVVAGPGVCLGYTTIDVNGVRSMAPMPTTDGVRFYYTGDEVILDANGHISYVGRLDDQVKRLGHRLNLGSLASRVGALLDAPVDVQVVAEDLVLAATATEATPDELLTDLATDLAPWELPNRIVVVDEIPVTPNGKIDHDLVRQELTDRLANDDEPADGNDDVMAVTRAVVEHVVGTSVAADASIFDCGATSLSLITIQAELGDRFGEDRVAAVMEQMDFDFTVERFVKLLKAGRPEATLTRENVSRHITGVVERLLGRQVASDVSVFDLGATSLTLVALQAELGDEYGRDRVDDVFQDLEYDFTVDRFVDGYLRAAVPDGSPAAEGAGRDDDLARLVEETGRRVANIVALPQVSVASRGHAAANTLVITGAGGFVGGRLLRRAVESGQDVVVVTSRGKDAFRRHLAERYPDLSARLGDLQILSFDGLASARASTRQWTAVVNCGFHVNHVLPLARQVQTSIESTRVLATAAARRGVSTFVQISSASVGPTYRDFDAPALAAVGDPYSQAKFVAEQYARALRARGVDADIMRLGLVYGHGPDERAHLSDDVFGQLVRASKLVQAVPPFGDVVPLCSVDAVVDHALAVVAGEEPAGDTYLLGNPIGSHQLAEAIGIAPDGRLSEQAWLDVVAATPGVDPVMVPRFASFLRRRDWPAGTATPDSELLHRLVQVLPDAEPARRGSLLGHE